MNRTKNKKHNHMLGRTPKIQPKELYLADSVGNLRLIDRGSVTKDGISFDALKKLELERSKELNEKIEYINSAYNELSSILNKLGYKHTGNELKPLINEITEVIECINNNGDNYGVSINENGYVNKVFKINHILNNMNDIPSDYNKGYWKIVDGEFVLDSERFNQLYGGTL